MQRNLYPTKHQPNKKVDKVINKSDLNDLTKKGQITKEQQ